MNSSKYIPGIGPIGAKLMIVSDCPNDTDLDANRPFTGIYGRTLQGLLTEAGYSISNCWLSNVVKYHIPPSPRAKKIPFHIRCKLQDINFTQCVEELQVEINSIKPNCILALGQTALYALTGQNKIQSYRGSILLSQGNKVVPTYHLGGLVNSTDQEFIGYWNRYAILFDIKRAIEESETSSLNLPQRSLQVCTSSWQLEEFRQRYKNYSKVSVDIEAGGTCLPVCIGLSFTPSHGMTVPLWNRDGISSISDSELTTLWLILSEILSEKDIVGQNFKYDQDKIRRLGFRIKGLVSDTLLKAFAINPELPKGLGFNTSIYTREPYYKDEGMYHGTTNDLFIGCARDACVTLEIDQNMDADLDELGMRDYYNNFIMPLHDMYLDIENQGFNIDTVKRDELFNKYIKWDERLRYELFKLIGEEINVNSPKQVNELLFEKFKLPARKGTGEEELTALLNSPQLKNTVHRTVMEKILEKRRVAKSISTYLMALPDFDGRMKTTYFLALETGRTSTGQQDPPIRPEVEVVDEHGKKKQRVLGTAFQTLTKHGDIGADIRGQFIPDNGEIFVQADSSQAEARVIFLLADDEQALRDIDEHDYHALTASWFFGGSEDDYSKRKLGYESPIRFAGKTLRHAGHLGAGKRRASIELNTQARKNRIPIMITEAQADRALKVFHSKQPKIQGIFHGGIIKALEKTRRLISAVPYGIEARHGGVRIFYERWGDELFRQAFSYIPQRSVSDNTKAAGLRLRKRIHGIKIVMEAHDALLFSIPENLKDEWIPIIREEMERPIRFDSCSLSRHELIIPCAVEIGHNYCDFEDWKFPEIVRPKPKELTIQDRMIVL